MQISERFAQFIARTDFDSLPEPVIAQAKERILDTVGAAVAGEANWELKDEFLKACTHLGAGDCRIWGSSALTFPVARAAAIHSTYAHAAELDDGHKNAGCHAGAVVVPTALTLGRELGASGKEILAAVAIGYEVVYRIVAHMTPWQIEKGFHPSGNCDTFGAMAVAGKLLKLTETQLAAGLGFAGLFAAGLMEATVSGQRSKCVQVGNAAFNGIAAAYYAREGMDGTTSIFEGKTGFFRAQAQPVDPEAVCRGLGQEYLIGDTYNKLYPTCRHAQPAIEGVLDLAEAHGFGWEDVAEVWVGTHQVAYDLTGKIYKPENTSEAKFSIPYGAALALHEHSVGICHLTEEYRKNPEILGLAALVKVEVDPEVQAVYPKKRGAKVAVTLKSGQRFEEELYDLKGSPKKPVGWKELAVKFRGNLTGVYRKEDIGRLEDMIARLATLGSVDEMMEILYG